jgi:hypothetical protein
MGWVLKTLRSAIERLLGAIVGVLMISLAGVVVIAVIYRKAGSSLVWYDEIVSILLAWLTYYAAALAALKRAHLGYSGTLCLRLFYPPRLVRLPRASCAQGRYPGELARSPNPTHAIGDSDRRSPVRNRRSPNSTRRDS